MSRIFSSKFLILACCAALFSCARAVRDTDPGITPQSETQARLDQAEQAAASPLAPREEIASPDDPAGGEDPQSTPLPMVTNPRPLAVDDDLSVDAPQTIADNQDLSPDDSQDLVAFLSQDAAIDALLAQPLAVPEDQVVILEEIELPEPAADIVPQEAVVSASPQGAAPDLVPARPAAPAKAAAPVHIQSKPSLFVPLDFASAPRLPDMASLVALYAQQDYDLSRVVAGEAVPGLILQQLPENLSAFAKVDPAKSKETFLKIVLPLCLTSNARVSRERDHVMASPPFDANAPSTDPVVRGLAVKYGATNTQDLSARIQPVPPSLCLAAAVGLSDWGQGVVGGTGLFGVPAATLQASVDAFVLRLNRASEHEGFRQARAAMAEPRARARALEVSELVKSLNALAQAEGFPAYDLARWNGQLRGFAVSGP